MDLELTNQIASVYSSYTIMFNVHSTKPSQSAIGQVQLLFVFSCHVKLSRLVDKYVYCSI